MTKACRSLQLVVAFCLLSAWADADAEAGTIEKKFPDGTIRVQYEIDDKGDKDGTYQEFYPDGKLKIKATYKADQLNGPYKSFHDNGKPNITAAYKDGKLTGSFVEETPEGVKKLTAAYKDGKLHGTFTRFEKGQPVLSLIYSEGQPGYSRSLADMKKTISQILTPSSNTELDSGLRRLKAYRYLAELPYENIQLDDEYNKAAQAAAVLSEKAKKLDHFPKTNPGLSEADFKLAVLGCKSCNLGYGTNKLSQGVDEWMDDSDNSNIANLGHRRWCLNPAMAKTGFGLSGNFFSMWCKDNGNKQYPDYDSITFPARGLMPVEFFGPQWAWNISLNPRKYRQPTDATQVRLFALDASFARTGEPLKLNFSKVSQPGFGVPFCVVFRPDKLALAPGKRFLVEIDGLTRADGKPAPLSYVVEFVSLK